MTKAKLRKTSVKVSVKQRQVHVNNIRLLRMGDGVAVFQADLKAKRAEIEYFSGVEVAIGAGKHTLHCDRSKDPTIVEVDAFPGQFLDATISRYTLTIFVYTNPEASEVIWSNS